MNREDNDGNNSPKRTIKKMTLITQNQNVIKTREEKSSIYITLTFEM